MVNREQERDSNSQNVNINFISGLDYTRFLIFDVGAFNNRYQSIHYYN